MLGLRSFWKFFGNGEGLQGLDGELVAPDREDSSSIRCDVLNQLERYTVIIFSAYGIFILRHVFKLLSRRWAVFECFLGKYKAVWYGLHWLVGSSYGSR